MMYVERVGTTRSRREPGSGEAARHGHRPPHQRPAHHGRDSRRAAAAAGMSVDAVVDASTSSTGGAACLDVPLSVSSITRGAGAVDQPDTAATLSFDGLTHRLGSITAVDRLSATCGPRGVSALLRRNGAGKTTTLRMLLGPVRPTVRLATINGQRYDELIALRCLLLGVVPHHFSTLRARTRGRVLRPHRGESPTVAPRLP
jgi:ABC-type glutathione transport system ATPase component